MAKSAVDICNLALIQIGHTQLIQDLTEDSAEANVCNTVYEQDRDEVLQEFPWPFATKRAKPAPLVATTLALGAVPTGWAYAFALPSDSVWRGLTDIFGGVRNTRKDQEVPFVIEYDSKLNANIVLCDLQTPEFIYVSSVTDPTLFSANFTRVLAWRISVDLVLGLRKDPKIGKLARDSYETSLGEARDIVLRGVRLDSEPVPAHIANR